MARVSSNNDHDKIFGYNQGKDIGQMQADIQALKREIQDLKDAKSRRITNWTSIICTIATVICLIVTVYGVYFTKKGYELSSEQKVLSVQPDKLK